MGVKDYSLNADDNTQINGINIAEGCPPSGINNAIRQLMADVKADSDDQNNTASTPATSTSLGPVIPQTGDEDGLELGENGSLRVREATTTQRGGVLASTTAAANTVPQAKEDGVLDDSWFQPVVQMIKDASPGLASKDELGLIKVGAGLAIRLDGTLERLFLRLVMPLGKHLSLLYIL